MAKRSKSIHFNKTLSHNLLLLIIIFLAVIIGLASNISNKSSKTFTSQNVLGENAEVKTVNFSPAADTMIVGDGHQEGNNFGSKVCLNFAQISIQNPFIQGDIVGYVYMFPVFRFNLSSIPKNAIISSARLIVHRCGDDSATFDAYVKRMIGNWTETNLTWNSRLIDTQNDPSRTLVRITHGSSTFSWDFLRQVQSWIANPDNNFGFTITPTADIGTGLFSREADDPSMRPVLEITYTIPKPTPSPTLAPPKILNVRVENITLTQAAIKWETDVNASSIVKYNKGSAVYSKTTSGNNSTKSHLITLSGLSSDSTYHYKVISKADNNSNEGSSTDHVFYTLKTPTPTIAGLMPVYSEPNVVQATDVWPPKISGIKVSDITYTSAEITWTTDEDASTYIDFGETNQYGDSLGKINEKTKNHSIAIKNLKPASFYHYRVKSQDRVGNWAKSTDHSFKTKVPGTAEDMGFFGRAISFIDPGAFQQDSSSSGTIPEASSSGQPEGAGGAVVVDESGETLPTGSPVVSDSKNISSIPTVVEKNSELEAVSAQLTELLGNTNLKLILAGLVILSILKIFILH